MGGPEVTLEDFPEEMLSGVIMMDNAREVLGFWCLSDRFQMRKRNPRRTKWKDSRPVYLGWGVTWETL